MALRMGCIWGGGTKIGERLNRHLRNSQRAHLTLAGLVWSWRGLHDEDEEVSTFGSAPRRRRGRQLRSESSPSICITFLPVSLTS